METQQMTNDIAVQLRFNLDIEEFRKIAQFFGNGFKNVKIYMDGNKVQYTCLSEDRIALFNVKTESVEKEYGMKPEVLERITYANRVEVNCAQMRKMFEKLPPKAVAVEIVVLNGSGSNPQLFFNIEQKIRVDNKWITEQRSIEDYRFENSGDFEELRIVVPLDKFHQLFKKKATEYAVISMEEYQPLKIEIKHLKHEGKTNRGSRDYKKDVWSEYSVYIAPKVEADNDDDY